MLKSEDKKSDKNSDEEETNLLLVTDVILGYIKSGKWLQWPRGPQWYLWVQWQGPGQVALMLELMVCTCLASAACMVQGLVWPDGDTDWGCCVCMNSPGASFMHLCGCRD